MDQPRITVATLPVGDVGDQDSVMHLIQDEETIADIHHCVLPPDEYYAELRKQWEVWWPRTTFGLLDHMISLLIAFHSHRLRHEFWDSQVLLSAGGSQVSRRDSWQIRKVTESRDSSGDQEMAARLHA